jgi:hypothetical protein
MLGGVLFISQAINLLLIFCTELMLSTREFPEMLLVLII